MYFVIPRGHLLDFETPPDAEEGDVDGELVASNSGNSFSCLRTVNTAARSSATPAMMKRWLSLCLALRPLDLIVSALSPRLIPAKQRAILPQIHQSKQAS